MVIALKHTRWQDAIELPKGWGVNALISDPPYSDKVQAGHNAGAEGHLGDGKDTAERRSIDYAHWGSDDVHEFCRAWSPIVSGWFCALTDHVLFPVYAEVLEELGRYVFQPIPCVIRGMTVRLGGDGPSGWAVYMVAARPKNRTMATWGTLPGSYMGPREVCPVIGGKPEWLMSAIIRDYTRPGDTIVDPCAGGATTLLCADALGRNAFGMEMDAATYAIAQARLDERARMGVQHDLFSGATHG